MCYIYGIFGRPGTPLSSHITAASSLQAIIADVQLWSLRACTSTDKTCLYLWCTNFGVTWTLGGMIFFKAHAITVTIQS
jgi:hypothetical protein